MKLTKNEHHRYLQPIAVAIAIAIAALLYASFGLITPRHSNAQANDPLTGNWAVRIPNADGTERVTYFNLKQEGGRITGSIRLTQFYYVITESTGGPEGFTLTGTIKDGQNARTVRYE